MVFKENFINHPPCFGLGGGLLIKIQHYTYTCAYTCTYTYTYTYTYIYIHMHIHVHTHILTKLPVRDEPLSTMSTRPEAGVGSVVPCGGRAI